jgi:hypothetical protein
MVGRARGDVRLAERGKQTTRRGASLGAAERLADRLRRRHAHVRRRHHEPEDDRRAEPDDAGPDRHRHPLTSHIGRYRLSFSAAPGFADA